MTTVAEARDLMLGHGTDAVTGVVTSYTDTPPVQLDGTVAWARVTVRHAGGGQRGMGDQTRRFERKGTLCIEIYTPQGSGSTDGDTRVESALSYLESVKSSQVWYRNIRASEIGQDGGYNKTNVYAEFEYESNHS